MKFEVTDEENEKIIKWLESPEMKAKAKEKMGPQQRAMAELVGDDYYAGAIGGHLTYSFTPTGLGVVLIVEEAITGEKLNLTDYDSW